jgi:hypothetical protein
MYAQHRADEQKSLVNNYNYICMMAKGYTWDSLDPNGNPKWYCQGEEAFSNSTCYSLQPKR